MKHTVPVPTFEGPYGIEIENGNTLMVRTVVLTEHGNVVIGRESAQEIENELGKDWVYDAKAVAFADDVKARANAAYDAGDVLERV